MKKLLAVILFMVMILMLFSAGVAESRLEEYKQKLTGHWKWVWSEKNSYGYYHFSADYIDFPSVESDESAYLTEGADGRIYLTYMIKDVAETGEVTFTDDGRVMVILPPDGGFTIYKKEFDPESVPSFITGI